MTDTLKLKEKLLISLTGKLLIMDELNKEKEKSKDLINTLNKLKSIDSSSDLHNKLIDKTLNKYN